MTDPATPHGTVGSARARPPKPGARWTIIGVVTAGLLGAVVGLTLFLVGRDPEPTPHLDRQGPAGASAQLSPSAAPSVAAQEASAPTVAVHPALSDAALRTVRVPAYCDMPEQALVDGKVPEGRYQEAHGELVLTGPAAPVRVDLDGDGTEETVANYSCGASYVAAGAHWPDLLIVYGWDGAIRGTVSLGDHILLPTADTTAVKGLARAGGTVAVTWVDTNRVRSFVERSGTLAWNGKVTFTAAKDLGVTTVTEGAAFVTPSGNIVCHVDDEGAGCHVAEHVWKAPPPTGECVYLSYGDIIVVSIEEGAHYGCTGGVWSQLEMLEPVSLPGRTNPEPSWFIPGVDTIAMEKWFPAKAYALSYGRTLRYGSTECTVTTSGVTCTETTSGHGFTVSKQSISLR